MTHRRYHRRHQGKGRFHRRIRPGEIPGSLVTDPRARQPVVTALCYGPDRVHEEQIEVMDRLPPLLAGFPVVWINVDGLGGADVLRQLAERFGIHGLALEDVVHVHQRAKVEHYGEHLFIVARMPRTTENGNIRNGGASDTEQLSLFLGRTFVLTFTEDPGDCFDIVRERIRRGLGNIRASGPDHLAYALLDAVVDNYFPVLERIGERLDVLEDAVLDRPTQETIGQIHEVKRDLLTLRRVIWPHREAVNAFGREAAPLVGPETQVYIRDLYDHVIQIMDLLETYRETAMDLRDGYLSSVSNRMNEVMKVLTVIATIFIPLTFITSIYGMNFDTSRSRWNMPELEWPLGYVFVWGVMLTVAAAMLYFFNRNGWLGSLVPAARRREIPDDVASGPPRTER